MKKTQKIILVLLSVFILVLSSVLLFVFMKLKATKFNEISRFDKSFRYENGVLQSKTNDVMRFVNNMGTFSSLEVSNYNLNEFDGCENFKDTMIYLYKEGKNIIPLTKNALPYYNLDNCFIYGGVGEEKYLVDIDHKTMVPLIDGSSKNVVGVCTNGEFLLEIDGKNINILKRRDRTTNEIVSKIAVEIKEDFNTVEFVAWYNERFALLKTSTGITTSYVIVDGATGEYIILATTNDVPAFISQPLESENTLLTNTLFCYNNLISNKFLQKYENVYDEKTQTYIQKPLGSYINIFDNSVFEINLDPNIFVGQNKLISVSEDGSYALYKTSLSQSTINEVEYVIVDSKSKKHVCLAQLIPENIFVDDAFFIYHNILFINCADMATSKEMSLAYKLSF